MNNKEKKIRIQELSSKLESSIKQLVEEVSLLWNKGKIKQTFKEQEVNTSLGKVSIIVLPYRIDFQKFHIHLTDTLLILVDRNCDETSFEGLNKEKPIMKLSRSSLRLSIEKDKNQEIITRYEVNEYALSHEFTHYLNFLEHNGVVEKNYEKEVMNKDGSVNYKKYMNHPEEFDAFVSSILSSKDLSIDNNLSRLDNVRNIEKNLFQRSKDNVNTLFYRFLDDKNKNRLRKKIYQFVYERKMNIVKDIQSLKEEFEFVPRNIDNRNQEIKQQELERIKKIQNTKIWKGDLDLRGNKYLTDLGNLEIVEGDLKLSSCINLTSLGNLKKVKGYLNLYGCLDLTSLGNLREVKGGCYLSYTGINYIPEDVVIIGNILKDNEFKLKWEGFNKIKEFNDWHKEKGLLKEYFNKGFTKGPLLYHSTDINNAISILNNKEIKTYENILLSINQNPLDWYEDPNYGKFVYVSDFFHDENNYYGLSDLDVTFVINSKKINNKMFQAERSYEGGTISIEGNIPLSCVEKVILHNKDENLIDLLKKEKIPFSFK